MSDSEKSGDFDRRKLMVRFHELRDEAIPSLCDLIGIESKMKLRCRS